MNCLCWLADQKGRNYITPEDVTEALETHSVNQVRYDLLRLIGRQLPYGIEDVSLCAFLTTQDDKEPL